GRAAAMGLVEPLAEGDAHGEGEHDGTDEEKRFDEFHGGLLLRVRIICRSGGPEAEVYSARDMPVREILARKSAVTGGARPILETRRFGKCFAAGARRLGLPCRPTLPEWHWNSGARAR